MKITTESSIDISESLACYILSSHISQSQGHRVVFEKRLTNINTGKYSIADAYLPVKNTAIEVKSIAHGSSALKGVIQASIYKEEIPNAMFCMQKPRRSGLRNGIEGMCATHGVGLIYIEGIPTICDSDTISSATNGVEKPFQLWKRSSYGATRQNIIQNSNSGWAEEYLDTLDQIIVEYKEEIFDMVVKPDPHVGGLSEVYSTI